MNWSSRRFATETTGQLFNDTCPCAAPAMPVEEAGSMLPMQKIAPPVRNQFLDMVKQIVLEELLNLKDRLDYLDLTGDSKRLLHVYHEIGFLCHEVDNGFSTIIPAIEMDLNKSPLKYVGESDVGEEQVYEVDVLDLFSPSGLGIQMTSLDGWRPS